MAPLPGTYLLIMVGNRAPPLGQFSGLPPGPRPLPQMPCPAEFKAAFCISCSIQHGCGSSKGLHQHPGRQGPLLSGQREGAARL